MSNILDIDVGNTRCKWRIRRHGECLHRGADDLDHIQTTLEAYDIVPNELRISCVKGETTERQLTDWSETAFGIEPRFARTLGSWLGLTVGYQDPSRLGVDRWLAMLAGLKTSGGNTGYCVIDCGSAITLDVVDSTGLHRGGYIVPGVQMMRNALLANTDRVRFSNDMSATEFAPGCNTATAVLNGTLMAALGTIERGYREMQRLVGIENCFITGGDAPALIEQLDFNHTYNAELVLDGLDHAFKERD